MTFDVLNHGSVVSLPLVLIAGVIAGLNPCCIAIYPAAAAMYCGSSSSQSSSGPSLATQNHRIKNALAFVLGGALATTILGVIAALAGGIIGQFGSAFRYAIAAVPLLMGLHLLGWLRLPINTFSNRVTRNGLVGALGAGFVIALALTPCGTPVLASVLAYVAYKSSVVLGAISLFIYGIGFGLPVVLVGSTADQLMKKAQNAGFGLWSERISGAALISVALFLFWKA